MRFHELALALVGICIPPATWALPSSWSSKPSMEVLTSPPASQPATSPSISAISKIVADAERSSAQVSAITVDEYPIVEDFVDFIKENNSEAPEQLPDFIVICRKYGADDKLVSKIFRKNVRNRQDRKSLLAQTRKIVGEWLSIVYSHRRNLARKMALEAMNQDTASKRVTERRIKRGEHISQMLTAYHKSL